MTVWDNPLLAFFAVLVVIYVCVSLFVLLRNLFRNWREYLENFRFLAAFAVLGTVIIICIGAVMAGVVWFFMIFPEQEQMKKCLTAHERRAYADAAPDDYFGRQLRDAATAEAKTCAELAAKKEAEAAMQRTKK
jgi:hypothetical protein